MKESIRAKFKRFYGEIEKNIEEDLSLPGRVKVTLDFLTERFFHNIELVDYIQYRFFYKKKVERRRFLTHGELVKIIKTCNNPQTRPIFDSKPLFNRAFNKYIGRDWLDASQATREEIVAFFSDHDLVFAKLPDGMFGKGIECFESEKVKLDESFVTEMKEKGFLLEEKLKQHRSLAEFNASSVNSFRVVTLVKADGQVEIMAAVIRIGRQGQIADNFHHYGIAALIDIETGLVYTQGVDREWKHYVVHPDSGKAIVGFQVPKWQEICRLVREAALVHPDVRYVGWDVAMKEDGGLVLIEGNPGADPDITQIPDQVGKWPKYRDKVREIEASSK